MDLRDLLIILVAELPETPEGSGTDLMPLISAETRHRQYDVTGLRRNEHGDVVFQLKDAEL